MNRESYNTFLLLQCVHCFCWYLLSEFWSIICESCLVCHCSCMQLNCAQFDMFQSLMVAVFRPLTYKEQLEGFGLKYIQNVKVYNYDILW